jgi:putative FmdB family regulatory protein
MPRYTYKCTDCLILVEVWHSITERLENCSSCNKESCMERVPSNFSLNLNKQNSKTSKKPGELVKESIEEFKQDLKQQKKDMINQEIIK